MSAALIELVSVGAQDVYITGDPQVSFFSQNYKALRHFARRLHCGGLTDYEASNGLVTAW